MVRDRYLNSIFKPDLMVQEMFRFKSTYEGWLMTASYNLHRISIQLWSVSYWLMLLYVCAIKCCQITDMCMFVLCKVAIVCLINNLNRHSFALRLHNALGCHGNKPLPTACATDVATTKRTCLNRHDLRGWQTILQILCMAEGDFSLRLGRPTDEISFEFKIRSKHVFSTFESNPIGVLYVQNFVVIKSVVCKLRR